MMAFDCASSAGAGIRPLGFPRIGSGGRSALRTLAGSGSLPSDAPLLDIAGAALGRGPINDGYWALYGRDGWDADGQPTDSMR